MRISREPNIRHIDRRKGQNAPIYSLDLNGSRFLATAGLDTRIHIWDLQSKTLVEALEGHTGSVLCVRWAPNSIWLASGSDDKTVLVWKKIADHWKPFRRLVGHESDVCDLAWSNSYLASCGLDNKILIFVTESARFELCRRLDLHTGFVKGLAFDPVGQYLASASDDMTLKIWRTSDWKLESEIKDPFKASVAGTFLKRMSWSPDGGWLAASNAVNGSYRVASIIKRGTWHSDFSLVGHEGSVEVASFSPKLFEKDGQIVSVCAVGSQDRTISFWLSSGHGGYCVQDMFKRDVLDITWASNGRVFYACSYDGTVICCDFEDELGVEVKDTVLQQKRREVMGSGDLGSTALVETARQLEMERKVRENDDIIVIDDVLDVRSDSSAMADATKENGGVDGQRLSRGTTKEVRRDTPTKTPPVEERMTANVKETVAKDGRRRVQPQFLQSFSEDTPTQASQAAFKGSPPQGTPKPGGATPVAASQTVTFNPRKPDSHAPKKISGPSSSRFAVIVGGGTGRGSGTGTMAASKVLFECNTASKPGYTSLSLLKDGFRIWTDYVSSPPNIVHVNGSPVFVLAVSDIGSLHFYSWAGRRLIPPMALGEEVALVDCQEQFALIVTVDGLLRIWDLKKLTCVMDGVNVIALQHLSSGKQADSANEEGNGQNTKPAYERRIVMVKLTSDGTPVALTSDSKHFTYHTGLRTWVESPKNLRLKRSADEMEETDTGASESRWMHRLMGVDQGVRETLQMAETEDKVALLFSGYSDSMSSADVLDLFKAYAVRLVRDPMEDRARGKIIEVCEQLLQPGKLTKYVTKQRVVEELLPLFARKRSFQRLVNEMMETQESLKRDASAGLVKLQRAEHAMDRAFEIEIPSCKSDPPGAMTTTDGTLASGPRTHYSPRV